MKQELTQERLKELLDYNHETGVFTRKVKTSNSVNVGDIAGSLHTQGYWQISVNNNNYLAHRLAWMYVYGVWPKDKIDHKNTIRTNNCIKNLREATDSQNSQNRIKAGILNKSTGLLGVSLYKPTGKFVSKIKHNGKNKHLGTFKTAIEAHNAYVKAKRELHSFNTL